jgi:hypothetical protein
MSEGSRIIDASQQVLAEWECHQVGVYIVISMELCSTIDDGELQNWEQFYPSHFCLPTKFHGKAES